MSEAARALRLFVGVRIGLAGATAIGEVASGLRRACGERGLAARFAAPAGYHVTLGFLGWTRPEAVTAVRDRVAAELAGAMGLSLATRGLGCFPDPARARILWVGVDDGGGRLAELAARVARAAAALGFAVESRPFHPHVTLARLTAASDLRPLLDRPSERLRSVTVVNSVVLFESTMKEAGSEYTPIAEWPLEDASKPVQRQTRPVERGHQTRDAAPAQGPGESDHGDQGSGNDDRG